MNQKILFQFLSQENISQLIKSNKQRKTLNFLNLHDIYQASKKLQFRKTLSEKNNINFIDGFIISIYLSLFNFKKVSRVSGPMLTRSILSNPVLSQNKKHFFIGLEKEDVIILQKKFPHLKKVSSYNPPHIRGLTFSDKEIDKIAKLINQRKPDYVWVGIGCPKQNILSSALIPKTKSQYFLNVGAALDFLLEKKKQAPRVVRVIGVEWLYRLITDFKHSKKKVWRSLIGLRYIRRIKLN